MVAHHTFLAHCLSLDFANCEVMELELDHDSCTFRVLTARAEPQPLNYSWLGATKLWGTRIQLAGKISYFEDTVSAKALWNAPANKRGEHLRAQPGL